MTGAGWIVGLHLLSQHAPNCYLEQGHCAPYNNSNPGIYFRAPSGLTVGGYTNSYRLPSAYAGWTFETQDRRFALTVAGVTGYPQAAVRPLVVPSVRLGLSERLSLRLAGAPRVDRDTAAVVHLSLEWRLPNR